MSENLKTIKELADELGVSKQAVWHKIKRKPSIDLRQFTTTKGNTIGSFAKFFNKSILRYNEVKI